MKFFKQLIVTVALAMSAFAAHADTFVNKDIGAPGDFNNTWTFLGVNDTAHIAGQQFNDFFIFNVPDTQYISVTLTSLLRGTSDGVNFLGGGFLIYTYSDGDVMAAVDATQSHTVTGASHVIQWYIQRAANPRGGANPRKCIVVRIVVCNSTT